MQLRMGCFWNAFVDLRTFCNVAPSLVNKQSIAGKGDRDSTIDSLRGLAAMAVVLHHVLHFAVKTSPDSGVVAIASFLSVDYVDWGRFGVVLFFLISGYVVPEYLIKGGRLSVFVGQRLLRIYPVFWVSVAAVFVFRYFDAGEIISWRALLGNATLFPQLFSVPWLSGVYWTLNIEVLFYIACMMLFLAQSIGKSVAWSVMCVIAVGSTVIPIVLNNFHLLDRRLPVQFTGFYVSFLVSGVLLRAWVRNKADRSCLLVALLPFLFVPIVAGSFFSVSGGFKLYEAGPSVAAHMLALAAFLYFVVSRRGRLGGWWLLIGRSSYSLYLFHWPICALVIGLIGLTSLGNFIIAAAIAVIASLVVAEVGYRWFEKPSINAGKQWRDRLIKQDGPVVSN